MPRVQVGYDPNPEGLQTTAAPIVQAIQARYDPNASKAFQLFSALGSESTQNAIKTMTDRVNQDEVDKAVAYANSRTVDELGKDIQDGKILESQSPVYNATLQHIYGQNSMAAFQRDTISKLTSGELSFGSPEELDAYLTKGRNEHLAGQSRFAITGYDKNWTPFRNSVLEANDKLNNAKLVQHGIMEAQDYLANTLKEVQSDTFKGTVEDKTARLLADYKFLTTTKLLKNDARKDALTALVTQIATTGDAALINSIVNSKIDNGISVGAIIGPELAAKAQMKAMQITSTANAQNNVNAAISNGALSFLPQQTVLGEDGKPKDFNQKDYAEKAILQSTANMPVQQQVMVWATNGLKNPEWEKQIQSGVSNIASVGWAYDGKNIGQLNPQGQAALSKYLEIAQVSPAEADKLAGSTENAKMLSDIKFMMDKGGMPDLNQAATFINQIRNRNISNSDIGPMKDKVSKAVDDVVDRGYFEGAVNWVKSLFGNGTNQDVNLTAMKADIRRRSELLVMSGQVPDAAAAVEASVKYFKESGAVTKINNTLYFTKDLPVIPPGQDPVKSIENFIHEVPGKIAVDQKMDPQTIRLEPNQAGGFTVWTGGVYLTDKEGHPVMYTKKEISDWMAQDINKKIDLKLKQKNTPNPNKSRSDFGYRLGH